MSFVHDNHIQDILQDLLHQQEDIVLGQLGELITANIIEVQQTSPVLVRDFNSNKLHLKQAIKLHFKGYERIAELEKENEELRNEIKTVLKLKEKYE